MHVCWVTVGLYLPQACLLESTNFRNFSSSFNLLEAQSLSVYHCLCQTSWPISFGRISCLQSPCIHRSTRLQRHATTSDLSGFWRSKPTLVQLVLYRRSYLLSFFCLSHSYPIPSFFGPSFHFTLLELIYCSTQQNSKRDSHGGQSFSSIAPVLKVWILITTVQCRKQKCFYEDDWVPHKSLHKETPTQKTFWHSVPTDDLHLCIYRPH